MIVLSGSGSASSGPSPTDLSGLELWLKADAITGVADGGNITTNWPDSSGNARNATAVQGSTDWPTWDATGGPNSKPRVKTYGAGAIAGAGWFSLPNFMSGFTAGNVFVFMRKISKSNALPANCGPPLGDWGTNTAAGDLFVFNTDQKIYDGTGSSARKTTVDPGDVTSAAFVYEIRSASGSWSSYKNGVLLHGPVANTVAFHTAPFIGHTTTNSARYDGWLMQVIFYSRILDNDTERKPIIHTFLNNEYTLTLPT